jgi:SAM-dependent methyltransferase
MSQIRHFDRLRRYVVHHIDRARAFRELRRILVPGGRLCIATLDPAALPHLWLAPLFRSYVEIERRRFRSADDLARELAAAGYAAVRVQDDLSGHADRIRTRWPAETSSLAAALPRLSANATSPSESI